MSARSSLELDPLPPSRGESTRQRSRRMLRKLTLYRDHVLKGTSDRAIMTLAGGGTFVGLWLMPPELVERELSKALGQIERENYGRSVPEWCVEPHNVLVKAFAVKVFTQSMPRN